MKRKVCPLLIQSDTNPSFRVEGQSWTRTYFLECLGNKCAAYHDYFCNRWETSVRLKEVEHEADLR